MRVYLASNGVAASPEITTKDLLQAIRGSEGTGIDTTLSKTDIERLGGNIQKFIDFWSISTVADTNATPTDIALKKNDALRLVYASLAKEMPQFQWTFIGAIVGGETVRAEIVRLGDLMAIAKAVENGAQAADIVIPDGLTIEASKLVKLVSEVGYDNMAHIQKKVVEGQMAVVTDIGKYALGYFAHGANERAANMVADTAAGNSALANVVSGFRAQALSDSYGRGSSQAAWFGNKAAIQLGIHEQTRLQSVLWDDTTVKTAARAMAMAGMVSADINTPIGKIKAPPLYGPWADKILSDDGIPYTTSPSQWVGRAYRGVWDLDYRIEVATNAFNFMHRTIHAPSAPSGNRARIMEHIYDKHYKNNNPPIPATNGRKSFVVT